MDGSLLAIGGAVCCVAVIVAIVVGAVVTRRREQARLEALHQWAAPNGWTVVRRPAVDWGRRLPGHNRRGVTLVLSGVVGGRPVSIADYHYTRTTTTSTSSDFAERRRRQTTTTYRYQVLVVQLRQPGPTIAVTRRGGLSRFGRTLFGDRSTAIGHDPFDSAYRVTAENPALVRSVLGPTLVAEHVAGLLPGWSLYGTELMTFHTGRIGDPAGIPAQFTRLLRVADLIESHA